MQSSWAAGNDQLAGDEMCADFEPQIMSAATKAKSLLGQLGPLAWALHSHHASVAPTAILLSVDPKAFVRIGVSDPCGDIKAGAVDCLEALRRRMTREDAPQLFTSEGLRQAVNRSIVVYAAAVLEQFLDEATEGLRAQLDFPAEKWPADSLGKIKSLRRDLCVDLRPTTRSDRYAHYLGAGWLVLVRNAVIHNDGVAPSDIGCDAGHHGLDRRWKIGKDNEEKDILVWDECDPVSRNQLAGKRFSIAIDHFILPRLRDAQAFVEEAACALRRRVRVAEVNTGGSQGGACE
ncbi:MAG: hypothetical protein MUQ65_03960 [Armatimonadetes bacterium]|nr:hypothetical protein [Armatimonadota bacterium]